MLPKVLVATTIYDGKGYIFDKYYQNIKNLDYPNYDILIVDNSRTNKYKRMLKKKYPELNILHLFRGKNSRDAVTRSSNYIRKYVIKNDYDYWMSIESDLIPPKDIITRLMAHYKPIVGTMYVIGYENSKSQPQRPCLFGMRRKSDGELETYNIPPEEGFNIFGNGLMDIHGCGLGTTLIKRELLELIKFWYLEEYIKHPDVYMYMDLHNMGHQVWCDTDLIIPHFNSDWNKVVDI